MQADLTLIEAMKEAHASGIEAFYNLRKYTLFHIYCILRPPRTKWKACLLFYVICMKVILFKGIGSLKFWVKVKVFYKSRTEINYY